MVFVIDKKLKAKNSKQVLTMQSVKERQLLNFRDQITCRYLSCGSLVTKLYRIILSLSTKKQKTTNVAKKEKMFLMKVGFR